MEQQTLQKQPAGKKMAIIAGSIVLAGLLLAGIWTMTSSNNTPQQDRDEAATAEPIHMEPLVPLTDTRTSPSAPSTTNEAPETATTTSPTMTAKSLEVQTPTLIVGDAWTWTDRTEKFLRIEKDALVFQLTGTSSAISFRYRTRSLNLLKDASQTGTTRNTRDPHTGLLQFPMAVGNTWTHRYATTDGTIKRQARYTVTKFAKVITPAGIFDAFKVEGTDQRDDRPFGIEVTYWYAPTAKAIVQMRGIDGSNGSPVGGWNYDLLSYTVAP